MTSAVFEQELPDMDHLVGQGAQEGHGMPIGALAAPKDELACLMIAVSMPQCRLHDLERHIFSGR